MATTKKQTERSADQKIRALEPGESIELFRDNVGTRTIAERSERGNHVRIVRILANGERVLGYDIALGEIW